MGCWCCVSSGTSESSEPCSKIDATKLKTEDANEPDREGVPDFSFCVSFFARI